MTREEAIEQLNFIIEISPKEPPEGCDYIDEWWKGHEDMITAFEMAIEALEQEPCEDVVSRAELKKWLDMNFSFGGALRKLELFERLDKELPSVIPKGVTVTDFADKCRECGKQKKGKWKRYIVDNGFNADWKCTECGYKVKTDFVHFNYCPNCGARMEE